MTTPEIRPSKLDILIRVREGAINTADATREEIAALVDEGLLKWTLPEGLRYMQTAAFHVGPQSVLPDFAALPKLHAVSLTPHGREYIRARLGFV